MEKVKESNKTYIDYFDAIIIGIFVGFFITQLIRNSYFTILSIFFVALYLLIFVFLKRKKSVVNCFLVLLMVFRYFYLTFLYDTTSVFTNAGYQYQAICDFAPVNAVYIGEMLGIFAAIYFYPYIRNVFVKIKRKYIPNVKFSTGNNLNILYLFMGIFAVVFIVIFPGVIPFIKTGRVPPNSLASVYRLCLVGGFLFVFDLIIRKIKKSYIAIPVLFVVFGIFAMFNACYGSITSRNLLIITTVGFLILLYKNFSKKNFIITISVIIPTIVFVFVFITIWRGNGKLDFSSFIDTLKNYFRINLYFSGPTNVNTGLSMFNTTDRYMGINQLFIDMGSNLPFISSSFFGNDTVCLFNDYIYHGLFNNDIMPLSVQAVIYFGPLFQWLFIAILIVSSLLFFDLAFKVKNNGATFLLAFAACVLAMGQMISFNATCMLIVLWPLAFFVFYFANYFVDKLVIKVKNRFFKKKVESNNEQPASTIKNHKVSVNYIFSLVHRLVLFVAPVITTPFLTAALKSYGLGQYASAYAYISYFMLVANLGFTYYGQREIARCNGDLLKEKKLFWEIFFMRAISTALALGVFFLLYGLNVFGNLSFLMLILSMNVLSCLFDISFFYQGKQNFVFVSVAQSLIKIVNVILVILFVKNESDLPLYALFTAGATLLQAMLLWPLLLKQRIGVSFKEIKPFTHLVPSLILFLPCLTGIIYTSGIKTMMSLLLTEEVQVISSTGETLTYIQGDIENGLFSQADKIIQMGIAVLTALGSVMASKNAATYAEGKIEEFKGNIYSTVKFVVFLSFPICLGIIGVANVLCPWFFVGDTFINIKYVLMSYAPLVVITTLSNVFGLQTLVTSKQDMKFFLTTLFGAVTAIGLGIPLILTLKVYGAVITALVSEAVVLVSSYLFSRKLFSLKALLKHTYKYMIAAVIMFVPIFFLSLSLEPTIPNTFILVCLGLFIYFVSLLILKVNKVRSYTKKVIGFVANRFASEGV